MESFAFLSNKKTEKICIQTFFFFFKKFIYKCDKTISLYKRVWILLDVKQLKIIIKKKFCTPIAPTRSRSSPSQLSFPGTISTCK